uniref:Kinesin motor domain-containing protein n=1 Tax=Prymnesium polylepis TaxID=72548 RepID=A0A7S4IY40_9EUKA
MADAAESASSLRFGARAACIENRPQPNEFQAVESLRAALADARALIARQADEISLLRRQLADALHSAGAPPPLAPLPPSGAPPLLTASLPPMAPPPLALTAAPALPPPSLLAHAPTLPPPPLAGASLPPPLPAADAPPPLLSLEVDTTAEVCAHLSVTDVLSFGRACRALLTLTASRAVWAPHIAAKFGDADARGHAHDADGRTLWLHLTREAWIRVHGRSGGAASTSRTTSGILLCR